MKQTVEKWLRDIPSNLTLKSGDTIDDLINKCNQIRDLTSEYDEVYFDVSCAYDSYEVDVYGKRLETDEEFTRRKEQHQKFEKDVEIQRLKREQEERKLYEKLKQKYETN